MKHAMKYTVLLLFALIAGFSASCDVEKERMICSYKVQLIYDYNEENNTAENMIEYYIHTIDEYIFDEKNILLQHNNFGVDRCRPGLFSEISLPPGRYSVIAIGNKDERSVINEAVPGVTRREDMLLTLENCEQTVWNEKHVSGASERLYHAYMSFTVKEQGISRIRVDMVDSYLRLKFRVKWKNGGRPARDKDYYALLEGIPSQYSLMPEYIYPAGSFECKTYEYSIYDKYPSDCMVVIHHIPQTCYNNNNILIHGYNTNVNVDNEMWGEFISYRIQNSTQVLLSVYTVDGELIVKKIDLQAYFRWYGIDLNSELKQDYELDIFIDGDKIVITPLEIADYEEGGIIKG